jgi:hypothetical protein
MTKTAETHVPHLGYCPECEYLGDWPRIGAGDRRVLNVIARVGGIAPIVGPLVSPDREPPPVAE